MKAIAILAIVMFVLLIAAVSGLRGKAISANRQSNH
jgi:hypothetical protein